MAHIRIEINDAGIQELLHECGATACYAEAQRIVGTLGAGYDCDIYDAGTRNVSSVFTTTEETYKDNLENNTILGAM